MDKTKKEPDTESRRVAIVTGGASGIGLAISRESVKNRIFTGTEEFQQVLCTNTTSSVHPGPGSCQIHHRGYPSGRRG